MDKYRLYIEHRDAEGLCKEKKTLCLRVSVFNSIIQDMFD